MPVWRRVANCLRVGEANRHSFAGSGPIFRLRPGSLIRKTLQMLKRRRKHLDLIRMRFPLLVMVPGIRRVRPAGLFLFIAILLRLQQHNVATPQSIQTFKPALSSSLLQSALLGLLWKSTV